ncbi:hypothetical protein HID58_024239 [Brassica napus]|uniref:Uncharacterized protein n=1 Tax=Brassica napus TaxID=3708 RepID=A0ABQ8D4J8_BRANA|nr:hypothetical protein HID58_024239 [Brassica napus]
MDEPNRKPFLGRKPIILNPKAPLHSLKVRERDACQDPHCEGPRITRPPRVDRTTIRETRVERSKPHDFTGSKRKRDQIFTLEPKTVEAIDLETSIYALKYIKRLRSNQKSTRIFRTRVDWTKEKQKRRSRTDSGSNRRRSRRKDGAIRATAFPETIAGEIRYHRFPESSSLTGDKLNEPPEEISSRSFIILNPKAPLHSLKVRERDACQDPHCEGPRITRPPRVDRTTIRETRVERSKPHDFTGMQTTVATILGNPPEVDNRFRQDQRESATKSSPWSPKPSKLLISKHRSTL